MSDWMVLFLVVWVAICAYSYGVGKPKRDRSKRQEAEYNNAMREGREPRRVP